MTILPISIPYPSLILIPIFSLILHTIYIAIYRLYLSPLSKFPGPKLAALTLWYEFYYNVICDGQWLWKIKRMHEEYGPIIRINPYELHIDDLEFYDELYAGSTRKREKYPWFVAGGGSPGSAFETMDHDLHRLRRSAINPYFSKRSITAVEPLIKTKISLLGKIFHNHLTDSTPVDLRVVFSSLTLDIISDYCYGESFGALTDDKLAEIWSVTLTRIMSITTILMHFPFLLGVMGWLPDSLAGPVLVHHRNTRKVVAQILNHSDKGARQNTIFHELRDSTLLPPQEKSLDRLAGEGNILVGAGGETTAQTLGVLFYHLLDNPDILERIKREVAGLGDNEDITWAGLEKLPFLSASITEALRISSIVTTRLPRVAPSEDIKFQKWTIPAGTPTSMSYYLLHYSPKIFPSPEKFDPTRWLTTSTDVSAAGDVVREHKLDKYFVPFSKGSRICLGINLAYAELFLTTALILKRFDFKLYETTEKDVEIKRDHFVAAPAAGSKGIRVTVTGDRGE